MSPERIGAKLAAAAVLLYAQQVVVPGVASAADCKLCTDSTYVGDITCKTPGGGISGYTDCNIDDLGICHNEGDDCISC
jgi:hypothetical protein